MTEDDIIAEVAGSCRATRARMEARRLTRAYDRALAAHGVRSTEFAVLVAVGRLRDGLMGEVADLLAMDISTLSRSAASLSKRGLLAVEHRGHRTKRLSLTQDGRALIVAAHPAWRAAQAG